MNTTDLFSSEDNASIQISRGAIFSYISSYADQTIDSADKLNVTETNFNLKSNLFPFKLAERQSFYDYVTNDTA